MKRKLSPARGGSPPGHISIRGARVHNLKNIDLDIPKNKFVVITGLSGSGKSSLAFDTIYAEAERRYVESLSAYARQFLGVKDKPDVESIDGLSPAISIDQKSVSRNPRSTVGTITEIYDYLRILFARAGIPHCPSCAKSVGCQTADAIVDAIARIPKGGEIILLAPIIRMKKGEHKSILEELKRAGFLRVRLDGTLALLDEVLRCELDKQKKHSIEVVVDRFALTPDIDRSRIRDSVEIALKVGKGIMVVQTPGARDLIFSEHFACTDCGINLPEIEPRMFSFNSPYGACPNCTGLGSLLEVDPDLVMPNKRLSLAEGAIRPWASVPGRFAPGSRSPFNDLGTSHRVGRQSWYWWMLDDLADRHHFSLNTPVENLPPRVTDFLLYGEKPDHPDDSSTLAPKPPALFEGVIPNLKRRWKETDSDFTRAEIEKYMIIKTCPACSGRRLRPEALAVVVAGQSIASISERTVEDGLKFFQNLAGLKNPVITPLANEIVKRLEFLQDVGLEYLTLARESTSLSGGEAQRIQLATQIGSRLTGIIYVLDEPSIGLHPRDHSRLIATLKNLRDLGNTVIVVEHDAQAMREADWIVDLGPGAGRHGGEVVFSGTPSQLLRAKTLTADYISGRKKIDFRNQRIQKIKQKWASKAGFLNIIGAAEHNLKNIDVKIPLGRMVCVSGVSGSGKSTLINDILAKSLLAKFYRAHLFPGKHRAIQGTGEINKAVVVDQSPIGRTPRSNPATYTGAFGFIRSLFSRTPEARSRGYTPGRFSFNVKGGRCEACEGQGVKKIEMYFLPDVYVRCEECRGSRYNREALEIEYNGKNIAQVLDMSIEEALKFFEAIPAVQSKFRTLVEVGLGYMKVGQPAPTLSGGEAQRVKLATELSRRDTGRTLYILDEPTTGLHFDDVRKLLKVLSALVEKENTVLVIEHNLDVLRNADWIIDLGPGGGEAGGRIVAEGTPEQIARAKGSYTGEWLRKHQITSTKHQTNTNDQNPKHP